MLNKWLTIILLVATLMPNSGTYEMRHILSVSHKEITHQPMRKEIAKNKHILYNTKWKSGSRDSLKRYLDPIFTPVIEQYAHNYTLSLDELVACIETIATSESGNSKGQPFSNSLFRIHNNPFGIKGNGTIGQTVEYYDGVRTVIHDGFASYSSLEDGIKALVGKFLLTNRYKRVREATTYIEFFTALKDCGYFTHPTWHKKYFIPTCRDYYL